MSMLDRMKEMAGADEGSSPGKGSPIEVLGDILGVSDEDRDDFEAALQAYIRECNPGVSIELG